VIAAPRPVRRAAVPLGYLKNTAAAPTRAVDDDATGGEGRRAVPARRAIGVTDRDSREPDSGRYGPDDAVGLKPEPRPRGVLFVPTFLHRAAWVGFGLGGIVICLGSALIDSPGWLFFVVPAAFVVLEGLHAQVEVDLDRRVVISARAVRQSVVPIGDIVNVRVPPWGPIVLTLRPDAPKPGPGLWPGQVVTGLYTDHRGRDGVARALASELHVPVVSIWPAVRSTLDQDGPDRRRAGSSKLP
jgi:hypothetical protein